MTQDELAEIGRLALAASDTILRSEYEWSTEDMSRCMDCGYCYGGPGHKPDCAWGKLVAKLKEVTP